VTIKSVASNVLSIILLGLTASGTFAQTPQTLNWSTTPPNVASVPWNNQQIASFLNTVSGSLVDIAVADFKFVDLDADGQLELLAAVDFSGRGQFNLLVVVRRTGDHFAVQQINALGVESVAGIFSDLNKDGKMELLVPTALTPYLGGPSPQAAWTAIHGWSGPLLVDISSQLSTYYQTSILPALKQNLDNLQAMMPGTLDVDIAQVEYDKTLRISGVDTNAGFAEAVSWSSSTDSTHRILAAAVLADIGTPSALEVLRTLPADPDPQVATYATASMRALPNLHFTPVNIEIAQADDDKSFINLKSREPIRVRIRSTKEFKATKLVDTHSLTFGSFGTEDSLISCEHHDNDKASDARDNRDLVIDVICRFDTQASNFQTGDAEAVLRGKLRDGDPIQGIAPVRIKSRDHVSRNGEEDSKQE